MSQVALMVRCMLCRPNNVTMCKFRAKIICDEVTDEITDVVYLPGNPYTVASQG